MTQIVKIGNISTQIRGVSYSKSDVITNMQDGYLPVLRANNIQEQGLVLDDFVYVPESKISEKQRILAGDVIIAASSGSISLVGKAASAKEDINAGFGAFCKILRPNTELVDPRYFANYFQTQKYRQIISNLAAGANINNLKNEHLDDLEIPLPPLTEQRRIASILDQADELRQKRLQAIEKLDQLLQATFIDMFGDPKINPYNFNIEKLSKFYIDSKNGTKCGPFGSALKRHEYVENGIPVWSMDVITLSGEFIDKPSLWITNEKFKELESYSVEEGDVIISRAGTVGKMGVVHSQYEKSLISTNLIRLRFGNNLLPEYFVALMTYCKHRLSRLQTGADGAFTHMNTGILDNLEFPYPPIKKQKQFVDFLYRVNINKQILLKSGKRINDLFSSLQNQAFNGTL